MAIVAPERLHSLELEIYDEPLPLVAKLPEYRRRGDTEIWLLHPYERTLTAWRRQTDGEYIESVYHGGVVLPMALPGVTVDLDALFR
jgi:Uma2 family endonuclease